MAVAFFLAARVLAQTDLPLSTLLLMEQGLMGRAGERPDDPEMRRQMADLRARIADAKQREGDKKGAMDYLQNSLQLDPEHPDLWEKLGDLANFIGHPSSDFIVQYAYEEALKRDPNRLKARAKLASAYLSSDRFLKSMEEFETVIRESPEPTWNHIRLLGPVYAMVEEIPRGIRFFEDLALEKERGEFHISAAILEYAGGNQGRALTLLRSVIESKDAERELVKMAKELRQRYKSEAAQ